MISVKLYGKLAKKFGKNFKFDVQTKAEAIRALMAAVKGFKKYINNDNLYTVNTNYDDCPIDHYNKKLNDGDTIRFIPVVTGGGGIVRIVLGAALMVFAPYLGVVYGSMVYGAAMSLGVSMAIGGVAELLFAPPEPDDLGTYEKVDNKPSYAFAGAVNTSRQGNPVPVGYGQLRVGSQIISAGMYSTNTPI